LPVPIPPWLEDSQDFDEVEWNNKSIDDQLKEWRSGDAITYSSECKAPLETDSEDRKNQLRQNCALIVFIIYYDLFYHFNDHVPKISDILAAGYQFEVGGILINGGPSNLAQKALAGHYYQLVREYCKDNSPENLDDEDIIIGTGLGTNCDNKNIPTRELVSWMV